MDEEIKLRLAAIKASRAAMTPKARAKLEKEERQAQRESWVRGMAPCEHGVLDWETCAQCREASHDRQ